MRIEEACDVNFSSKSFLIIKIRFLTNILHLTSERKMKGRKAMFIQGNWAVVQQWVPDAAALKTLAFMEGLVSFMVQEAQEDKFPFKTKWLNPFCSWNLKEENLLTLSGYVNPQKKTMVQAGLSEKSEHLRGIRVFVISIYYRFWCHFHSTAHLSQLKRIRSFL